MKPHEGNQLQPGPLGVVKVDGVVYVVPYPTPAARHELHRVALELHTMPQGSPQAVERSIDGLLVAIPTVPRAKLELLPEVTLARMVLALREAYQGAMSPAPSASAS